jgi:hypothetical protein
MNATSLSSIDPALQRLHEVTARIRRRAAEARARAAARARRPPQSAARLGQPRQSELPLPMPPAEPGLRAA